MPADRSFCTMVVEDQLFGVDVLQVQEIIGEQHITPVPLGPPTAIGLLNLRGEIVPAISLRTALGLAERSDGKGRTHVVVRRTSGLASIVVDGIGDVVDVDEALLEPVPATLNGRARALVLGVHKLERRLLLELDVARALAIE
jgi:purine-binding chemotaxis protein CheW